MIRHKVSDIWLWPFLAGPCFRGLKAAATPEQQQQRQKQIPCGNDKPEQQKQQQRQQQIRSIPESKERSLGTPVCGNDNKKDKGISSCRTIVVALLKISNWYLLGLLQAA